MQGALSKVEMTKGRADHKPHLSLFHFRTLAGPLSSICKMITSQGFLETGHYSDQTLFDLSEQGNDGL